MKTMNPLAARAVLCSMLLASVNTGAAVCQSDIPPNNPSSIYIDNNDETVTDQRTGLMWKRCVEGLSGVNCASGSAALFTWAEALDRAENHSFAGHDDWRLPNIRELRSLVEEYSINPTINTSLFPNTPSSAVWSSSPYAGNSDFAWGANFYTGGAGGSYRKNAFGVRLVRGGQS